MNLLSKIFRQKVGERIKRSYYRSLFVIRKAISDHFTDEEWNHVLRNRDKLAEVTS